MAKSTDDWHLFIRCCLTEIRKLQSDKTTGCLRKVCSTCADSLALSAFTPILQKLIGISFRWAHSSKPAVAGLLVWTHDGKKDGHRFVLNHASRSLLYEQYQQSTFYGKQREALRSCAWVVRCFYCFQRSTRDCGRGFGMSSTAAEFRARG